MRWIVRLVLAIGILGPLGTGASALADDPKTLAKQGGIGVVAGGIDGTYLRIASDLSAVLDAGGTLRVLPMIGKGSVQNLYDLRYLRGVDIAIVQSDALTFLRQDPKNADVFDQIRYVTKLYNEEFHILASRDVQSVEDLKGRKVNTDLDGSGTGMTAGIVFKSLGIPIEESHLGQNDALAALAAGKIDAAIFVVGKPAKLFSTLDAAQGLHFITVPQNPALLATYLPAQLGHEDYPTLIAEGAPIDTVAVGAVMAIYNLPPNTERYARAGSFVESFFGSFDKFLVAPRHPKWREVNLAADLPGWRRFDPATEWLRRHGKSPSAAADAELRRAFDVYLDQQAKQTASPSPSVEQKAVLFERFQQWQKVNGAPAPVAAKPHGPVVPPSVRAAPPGGLAPAPAASPPG
ncbi:MAG TPA: TAXI family TRAP transporter solute-binding subunit [Aliidongia sp.]|uniref:TAXI family TRAP transporter solute-binding subunit n=1 Tax=Aliidongia sp. TaxID=1914230 RepID=UPI002DDDA740|nr:TAXI family TRAP transporter solute-binding subunit [Aliidongia sp.]HEV2673620.1 TAXI family TRAP transporter solute-binding subunit [Aliidongia sp.]